MKRPFPTLGPAPSAAVLVCAALLLPAAALPGAPKAPATVHTVTIDGMRFIPQNLEVRAGDTVVWRNKDPFPHTATRTGAGGGPDSPAIAAGASWTWTAAKPGSYPYLCTLHRTMTGNLLVK